MNAKLKELEASICIAKKKLKHTEKQLGLANKEMEVSLEKSEEFELTLAKHENGPHRLECIEFRGSGSYDGIYFPNRLGGSLGSASHTVCAMVII